MSGAEEWLDLVNEQDEVIGTIARADIGELKTNQRGYVRAVDLFIQNDKGELWIPKRGPHKQIAPNGLDYSMGGHVDAGETYITAALRELDEELNLQLDEKDLKFVKKFPPTSTPYFRCVYMLYRNETPSYNPDDFVSAEWLSPHALLQKLNSGVDAKQSIKETIIEIFDI